MQVWERDALPEGLSYFGYCRFDRATKRLDRHAHEGMEFIVLAKGSDCYAIENRLYDIHGGEAFIAWPQQIHASGREYQGIGEYYWFQLDLGCQGSFLGLSEANSRLLRTALAQIDRPVLKVNLGNIQILKSCYKHLKAGNYFLSENLLVCFLYHLAFDSTESKQPDIIGRIQAYIQESLSEPLSARLIARRFYISVSTLQHSFYKNTGQTLVDYINIQRIEKAKELLAGGKSVTITAMLTGFSTANYFAAIFKRYTSSTPRGYQKSMNG